MILVGCPIHSSKEYSFDEWIEAIARQRGRFRVRVIDNSPSLELYNKYRRMVPMLHSCFLGANMHQRVAESMNLLRREALETDLAGYLNIDSDVIPQSDDLFEKMIARAMDPDWTRSYQGLDQRSHSGPVDWLINPAPGRQDNDILYTTFSCVLFSREILEQVSFLPQPPDHAADGWYYQKAAALHRFNILNLPFGELPIAHRPHPDPEKNIVWTNRPPD